MSPFKGIRPANDDELDYADEQQHWTPGKRQAPKDIRDLAETLSANDGATAEFDGDRSYKEAEHWRRRAIGHSKGDYGLPDGLNYDIQRTEEGTNVIITRKHKES